MEKKEMKFLFIVQGEGRGHLTQALALKEILKSSGHKLVGVMAGQSPQRTIPDYFIEKMNASLIYYDSPNYIRDSKNRSIKAFSSLLSTCWRIGRYIKSIRCMQKTVQKTRPDIIINFFEPLAGIYSLLCRPQSPVICIGHQYLFLHPGFRFPPGRVINKWAAKIVTRITAIGAERLLALSFYPLSGGRDKKIVVMPPLLRDYILKLSVRNYGHYLFYILNEGYSRDIISLHRKNPDLKSICFWDRPKAPERLEALENLTFYQLNGDCFLEAMATSKAVITTGGFETACEALYLKKPIVVIPVSKHYDQVINAYDLNDNAKLGRAANRFDRESIDDALSRNIGYDVYLRWVQTAKRRFVHEIQHVIESGANVR